METCRQRQESRPGHATARLKPLERGEILLEILDIVRVVIDPAILEQGIELESGEAKQLTCLVVRERARSVATDRQGFERFSPRIRSLNHIVRQFDRNLHSTHKDTRVSRWRSATGQRLLLAQGDQGVDAGSAAGGDVAGDQGHQGEYYDHRRVGERIGGFDAE